MGDQIAPGDQIGDQIFNVTKMWKSGRPIWSPGAIWSSNEACFNSDLCNSSLLIWSAIWSPRSNLVTWSDLVAHQVAGASGRRSGRGRCIQLKNIPFWQGDIVPQQYGYIWKVYKKVDLNFWWSVQILVPWGGGASREGLGSMPEWQVGINSHKWRDHFMLKKTLCPPQARKKSTTILRTDNKIAYFSRCF